jgi:hypothetical protein
MYCHFGTPNTVKQVKRVVLEESRRRGHRKKTDPEFESKIVDILELYDEFFGARP